MRQSSDTPDRPWAIFGRGMAVLAGIVFLTVASYGGTHIFSLLLRIWMGLIGSIFIYAAFRA